MHWQYFFVLFCRVSHDQCTVLVPHFVSMCLGSLVHSCVIVDIHKKLHQFSYVKVTLWGFLAAFVHNFQLQAVHCPYSSMHLLLRHCLYPPAPHRWSPQFTSHPLKKHTQSLLQSRLLLSGLSVGCVSYDNGFYTRINHTGCCYKWENSTPNM